MQSLATELSLPATAFVRPLDDGSWAVRFFNPKVELPMCGHASLAVAHTLLAAGAGAVPPRQLTVRLQTQSGAVIRAECPIQPLGTGIGGQGGAIRLIMPADPPREVSEAEAAELRPAILSALGLSVPPLGQQDPERLLWLGRTRFDTVTRLSPDAFASVAPDFAAIAALPGPARILTVTTLGGGGAADEIGGEDKARGGPRLRLARPVNGHLPAAHDIVSRCFQPRNGVPEDPVCGAAHCQLAAFWGAQPEFFGGRRILALQASPRGGSLQLEWEGVEVPTTVVALRGACETTVVGRLAIPLPIEAL